MSSTLKEGDSLAAVDLGSNSFHLVVARYEHGDLRVIDRVRETVRMALGLRPDGTLLLTEMVTRMFAYSSGSRRMSLTLPTRIPR